MNYSALIPVKTLAFAKSRLAIHLSRNQREKLVLDMLQHVISTFSDSELFEQIYVVSADPSILEVAHHWGAEPLREAQQGHNPALQAAAQTILERVAWRHGVSSTRGTVRRQGLQEQQRVEKGQAIPLENFGLLTISADLPLITQADIQALIAQAERYQVVLAGSSEGTGTNAILLRPPLALPYLFGPGSLPAYIQAARKRHVSYTLLRNANLAFDIDTIDDLRALEQRGSAWSHMASLALAHGVT